MNYNNLLIIIAILSILIFILCAMLWHLYLRSKTAKDIRVGNAVSRQLFDVWPLGVMILNPDKTIE